MFNFSFRVFLPIFMLFSVIISCSPASTPFRSLIGEGVLPLSTTNAYQATNLFLASELESSSYLFQFMKTQGAPSAIELKRQGLSGLEMVLFYPESGSAFIGTLRESKEVREWLVRGPYGIRRQDYVALRRAGGSFQGEPVFEIHGKSFRFQQSEHSSSRAARHIEPEIPVIPRPTPTPTPKPEPSEPLADLTAPKTGEINFEDPNFIPANTNQEVLMLTEGYARRDRENGDILHEVEEENENLLAITTWYTGDSGNFDKIKDVNKRSEDHLLEPGEVIRIPREMIRRTKKMPLQPFRN